MNGVRRTEGSTGKSLRSAGIKGDPDKSGTFKYKGAELNKGRIYQEGKQYHDKNGNIVYDTVEYENGKVVKSTRRRY